MVSPAQKKSAVEHVLKLGLCSLRRACRYLRLNRSVYHYRPRARQEAETALVKRVIALSLEHPRYGYRFITELLRREGWTVSLRKVQRLRRKEGLGVKPVAKKARRRGESTTPAVTADRPNAVWCWDFIFDRTEDGRTLKILSLVDEYSRYCIRLRVEARMTASTVVETIREAVAEYGAPTAIRSDNGSEFVANEIRQWLEAAKIGTIYIEPGSPWQNPWVESFHSRLREECLNRELFYGLAEARLVIGDWREHYNNDRPHSGINYKSPSQVYQPQGSGSGRAAPSLRRSLAIQSILVPNIT
jgi:transposase InsO family protein